MAPQEAVDAPRIHHQWLPDEVYYEQRGVSADSLNILKSMGYKMVEQSPWGAAELILVGLAGVEGVSPANSGILLSPAKSVRATCTVPMMSVAPQGLLLATNQSNDY